LLLVNNFRPNRGSVAFAFSEQFPTEPRFGRFCFWRREFNIG
jgi:hypothetical protein